jgi:hypothetical protein
MNDENITPRLRKFLDEFKAMIEQKEAGCAKALNKPRKADKPKKEKNESTTHDT